MPMTGLPNTLFSPEGIEFYGKINLMKAGIVFADATSTVSKKYSQEIQTPEFGCGLDGVLRTRRDVLYGITNGVDYTEWNPAVDSYIVRQYNQEHLEGKKACKRDLLAEYGLPQRENTSVLGMISRLIEQKGCAILAEALERIIALDVAFVLLGTGEEQYRQRFHTLSHQYPDQIGVKFEFNNRLAHKIEAGADMFLMPSRFEPCGLNQIYSLKYGTIPIVRATGGLDDTIQPYKVKTGRGNGFKFQEYSATALFQTVAEAVTLYRQNPKAWHKLLTNAMQADFSWQKVARYYLELYRIAKAQKLMAVR
jgi:starch synthase